MERGTSWATVHGFTRVGWDLVAKLPTTYLPCWARLDSYPGLWKQTKYTTCDTGQRRLGAGMGPLYSLLRTAHHRAAVRSRASSRDGEQGLVIPRMWGVPLPIAGCARQGNDTCHSGPSRMPGRGNRDVLPNTLMCTRHPHRTVGSVPKDGTKEETLTQQICSCTIFCHMLKGLVFANVGGRRIFCCSSD